MGENCFFAAAFANERALRAKGELGEYVAASGLSIDSRAGEATWTRLLELPVSLGELGFGMMRFFLTGDFGVGEPLPLSEGWPIPFLSLLLPLPFDLRILLADEERKPGAVLLFIPVPLSAAPCVAFSAVTTGLAVGSANPGEELAEPRGMRLKEAELVDGIVAKEVWIRSTMVRLRPIVK